MGIWTLATDTDNQCKKGDWENDRTDGMMSVTARSIEYWESSCEIIKATKSGNSTVSVDLACGGEGMTWSSKEILYVQKVHLRKQLVSVSLSVSDERDEAGKRSKLSGKHKISVSIYLECN